MLKRTLDLVVSGAALVALLPIMFLLWIAVKMDSPGPALFWSQRFGQDERLFSMPKFRTMRVDTPHLATHLLDDGPSRVTRIGGFLRRTSLDELPQLWSVLKGDMSLVGPRPALFNQEDLMDLRRAARVVGLRPGITGWAQVNGRDSLDLEAKVAFEAQYAERQSFVFDLRILYLTGVRVLRGDDVAH